MKNLYIVGVNFFDFRLVEDINRQQPSWNIVGFIGRSKLPEEKKIYLRGYPLVGGYDLIPKLAKNEQNYFVHNQPLHSKATKILRSAGCQIATLIHPSINLSMTEIGEGCILPEGCMVGQYTRLGNFVVIRSRGYIAHDVMVEDNVFIGPNATIGGNSVIESGSFIGMGAIIMNTKVGKNSVVGAGSVVIKEVEAQTVVVGVPAKPIRKK
ncbi:DapH/DapD/GlmU-related protein [Ammoniphilus sp. CFH 90114]|uniref:DapH/DapD/GlmU-related protein n=1 Tax=Ammoniphilus sp. CFH 90114 TaxID=2493665 RepID=UPI00100E4319|nr:DapH/DapD/GlmU-related protein [Ammoniphilus sp. CFH 90114]RXT14001.1 hypothetical protein EIZ39_07655 [Ammoniphilus sp. CFH 90114]